MNTELTKNTKIDNFFKLIYNVVFGKIMENARKKKKKYQACKTEARRIYLVSEPNNYTTKSFSEKILAIEMKKHKYPRINQPI